MARIARKISPRGGLLQIRPLSGGTSATTTALEIAAPDGQRREVVVRHYGQGGQRQRALAGEYRLLQVAAELRLLAPAPLLLDESDEIFPHPYMVVEYIDGAMDFAPADPLGYVERLAAQLAAIHGADHAARDLSFLRAAPAACGETGGDRPPDEQLAETRIRQALAAHAPPPARNAPALLHGDFWPGNTLWRDGELVAVIDWEDAVIGDPLVDLAQTRSEIAWIFGGEALDAFSDRYRAARDLDWADLPYWDLCAALRFLRFAQGDIAGMAEFFRPYGRGDISERTIRRDLRYFVDRALAALGA